MPGCADTQATKRPQPADNDEPELRRKKKKSKVSRDHYPADTDDVKTASDHAVNAEVVKKRKKAKQGVVQERAVEAGKLRESTSPAPKERESKSSKNKTKKSKSSDRSNGDRISEPRPADEPSPKEQSKASKKKSKSKERSNATDKPMTNNKPASSMTSAEAESFREKHAITVNEESEGSSTFLPFGKFSDTALPDTLLSCTSSFSAPSPIQAQCWPILLAGRDCIGIAETGSGKTLGFTIPALGHVLSQDPLGSKLPNRGPIVLVLAPTRELAMQSAQVCIDAGKPCNLKTVCVFGGGDKREQADTLRAGCHVIVATPGRLLGYIRENVVSLKRVSFLILDEADRMLGMSPRCFTIVIANMVRL